MLIYIVKNKLQALEWLKFEVDAAGIVTTVTYAPFVEEIGFPNAETWKTESEVLWPDSLPALDPKDGSSIVLSIDAQRVFRRLPVRMIAGVVTRTAPAAKHVNAGWQADFSFKIPQELIYFTMDEAKRKKIVDQFKASQPKTWNELKNEPAEALFQSTDFRLSYQQKASTFGAVSHWISTLKEEAESKEQYVQVLVAIIDGTIYAAPHRLNMTIYNHATQLREQCSGLFIKQHFQVQTCFRDSNVTIADIKDYLFSVLKAECVRYDETCEALRIPAHIGVEEVSVGSLTTNDAVAAQGAFRGLNDEQTAMLALLHDTLMNPEQELSVENELRVIELLEKIRDRRLNEEEQAVADYLIHFVPDDYDNRLQTARQYHYIGYCLAMAVANANREGNQDRISAFLNSPRCTPEIVSQTLIDGLTLPQYIIKQENVSGLRVLLASPNCTPELLAVKDGNSGRTLLQMALDFSEEDDCELVSLLLASPKYASQLRTVDGHAPLSRLNKEQIGMLVVLYDALTGPPVDLSVKEMLRVIESLERIHDCPLNEEEQAIADYLIHSFHGDYEHRLQRVRSYNNVSSCLFHAIRTHDINTMALLLDTKCTPKMLASLEIEGLTLPYYIVRHGAMDKLRVLLDSPSCTSELLADSESSLLHAALDYPISITREKLVQLLLNSSKCHSQLAKRNKEGKPALHIAVESGDVDMVRVMLTSGRYTTIYAGILLTATDSEGKTVHDIAIERDDAEMVAALFEFGKCSLTIMAAKNLVGQTRLHEAAEAGHMRAVNKLMSLPAMRQIMTDRDWIGATIQDWAAVHEKDKLSCRCRKCVAPDQSCTFTLFNDQGCEIKNKRECMRAVVDLRQAIDGCLDSNLEAAAQAVLDAVKVTCNQLTSKQYKLYTRILQQTRQGLTNPKEFNFDSYNRIIPTGADPKLVGAMWFFMGCVDIALAVSVSIALSVALPPAIIVVGLLMMSGGAAAMYYGRNEAENYRFHQPVAAAMALMKR